MNVWNADLTCVCPCIVVICEEETQLDATQCFIELVICSTCFRHVYAHHQELATILLVWHVTCNLKLSTFPLFLLFLQLTHYLELTAS